MAVNVKKHQPVLLEKGCKFRMGIRTGQVLELRKEGYLVHWDAWVDYQTGESHDSASSVISFDAVQTENLFGSLRVLERPLKVVVEGASKIRRSERTPLEIARMRWRRQYVLAIAEMIDAGELKLVRDDFEAKIIKISARGREKYAEFVAAQDLRAHKRGGSLIRKSDVLKSNEFEFRQTISSGRTYWNWYWAWQRHGEDGLFDDYRRCGGHPRHSDETRAFVSAIVDQLLDEERVTIKSIVEAVQACREAENEKRQRQPIPAPCLPQIGYGYVKKIIREVAPIGHAILGKGWDNAYQDMHSLGVGVKTSRALERVEIDEYKVDLMVLMRDTGLFDHLPEAVKGLIGLDGRPFRVTLSAAIDVHTRCLLALQVVPQAAEDPLRDTLEMIYTDKKPISDAANCIFEWNQYGAPETIVLDRGHRYVTDEAYDVLASLGITNMGAPAGKPWLKPFIERVFRTIHDDLLLRFSGRTFGSVEKKGDNDAAARATLTLEAFLFWLVRWTVDAYHTKVHPALGMSPNQAWKKAVKECSPRTLTNYEMREAFGQRFRRKLGRHGVRVRGINYQSEEAIKLHYTAHVGEVEVLRWHGDIGVIEIRADDGPWLTVPAADQQWIGKTDTDLTVWLESRKKANDDETRARYKFIREAMEKAIKLKRFAGLISMPRTPEDLERDVERFSRYADTAERRRAFGEYRDILADVDEEDGAASQLEPTTPEPKTAHTVSDDDLME